MASSGFLGRATLILSKERKKKKRNAKQDGAKQKVVVEKDDIEADSESSSSGECLFKLVQSVELFYESYIALNPTSISR